MSVGRRWPSENYERYKDDFSLWIGVRISACGEPRKTGGFEDPSGPQASGHFASYS